MQEKTGDLLTRAITLKKLQDKRYNFVELVKDPKTENFYTKKFEIFTSEESANDLKNKIAKRMKHPNLFYGNIADYKQTSIQDFCSSFYKLETLIPHPEEDLAKDLRKKLKGEKLRLKNEKFSDKELTLLMYNLILGMHHLHKMGFSAPYLSPKWIAKTTTGYAVLDDPYVDLRQPKPFLISEKECYLSPEAYKNYQNDIPLDGLNLEKSDTFTVGMILLECATLKDVSHLYQGKSFLREQFEILMEEMLEKYKDNVLFCSSVKRMLRFEPSRRTSFGELVEKLPDYRQIIKFFENKDDEGKPNEKKKESFKKANRLSVPRESSRVARNKLMKPILKNKRPNSVMRRGPREGSIPSEKRYNSLSIPRASVCVNNPVSRRVFKPPVAPPNVDYNPLERTITKKSSTSRTSSRENPLLRSSSRKRVTFSPEMRIYYPRPSVAGISNFVPVPPPPKLIVRPIPYSPGRVVHLPNILIPASPIRYISPCRVERTSVRRISPGRVIRTSVHRLSPGRVVRTSIRRNSPGRVIRTSIRRISPLRGQTTRIISPRKAPSQNSRERNQNMINRSKSPLDYTFKLKKNNQINKNNKNLQKNQENNGNQGKCVDFEKCYESQQREPLKEDSQSSKGYPIEDPRNPFHEEYLKLKRKFDGYTKEDLPKRVLTERGGNRDGYLGKHRYGNEGFQSSRGY